MIAAKETMSVQGFPRALRDREAELLEIVLPAERPGYRAYREAIAGMAVIGQGRRGIGHLVLGRRDDTPDHDSPLTPVIAYGGVDTTRDAYSITVREQAGRQIDVEIVSRHGEEIPDHYEEKRRWTYSSWLPGSASPASGAPVREVGIDPCTVLALALAERRLWVWEESGGIVRLIPVTPFCHAVMQVLGIRDPETALRPSLVFDRLGEYGDRDLCRAFVAYNAVHPKVTITQPAVAVRTEGWGERIRRWLRRTH